MHSATREAARILGCALAIVFSGIASAQIDIVTQRYDDSRLGANLAETTLDTTNVNVTDFGKLWSYTVSGSVYAQPLYVRNVDIAGGTHNVLYVVTMNDIVYAFDADSPVDAPLASFDFTTQVPGSTPVAILDVLGYNDNIIGNVGIEGTPVIDLSTMTMYLVVRTRELGGSCGGQNPTFCQRLHAIDITTLAERPGSPVLIGGSVPCSGGDACDNGTVTFDTAIHDQRPSLALSNGRVFIAWSSHSDAFFYQGWVMVYDAATLQQTRIWSSAPDGTSHNGAGIWMGGRGPAIDADGNVYYMTGNGTWDGVDNFGESFVKFGSTPDAPLLDWFTPHAVDLLNDFDLDLSGSGPILLPGTDLILGGGKSGYFYLTHTDNLGHMSLDDMNAAQVWENNRNHDDYEQIKGGPVYWNRDSGAGPWMYVWSDGCNNFNAYHFNGSTFDLPPVSQSTMLSPCGSSGGVLTLSANGSTPGSGIVWSSMPVAGDANSGVHPGLLRAFDADDLTVELWNSNLDHARDDAGNWPKFSAPTVVNGRVYLGSFPSDGFGTTAVNVYGLLASLADFSLSATPPNPGANPGNSVAYTISLTGVNGLVDPVHLEASALAPGVTAIFAGNDLVPPAETTLQLDIAPSVLPGEYAFSIDATSGDLAHSVTRNYYVTEAPLGLGIIGIDFVGGSAPLEPEGVAGWIPKPNWNEANGASGSQFALFDEASFDTGATLAWSAGGTGALGLADDSADIIMMDGYLDADSLQTIVTVANLPPYAGGYYIYIYADGDNGATSAASTYTLSGEDGTQASIQIVDDAGATFGGTFVRADDNDGHGNYAVRLIGGTGFTLTVQPSIVGGAAHAPLNGIQIVRGDRLFANGFD